MTDNDIDTKPLHGPNLILDVENFGPIAEAKNLEFRPMTVFVGPSNTGKSYLAMLLHAMVHGMNGFRSVHTQMMNTFYANKLSKEGWKTLATETARQSSDYGRFNVDAPKMLLNIDQYSHAMSDVLNDLAKVIQVDLSWACISSIVGFFEEEITELGNTSIMNQSEPSIELADEYNRLMVNTNTDRLNFRILDEAMEIDARFHRLYSPENCSDEFAEAIAVAITRSLLQMILKPWSTVRGSIYFPAARTGILTSHKLMTDSLIANAHHVGIDAQSGIAYHKVARDFLRLINLTPRDLAYPKQNASDPMHAILKSVARRIEESVIMGEIEVLNHQWGPPDFFYLPNADKAVRLPMFRSSSMVTEIAPIVHFLRTHVRMGDLLIIEEPEAHLHPAAQQKMAAILAYMVRVGLRVLVTTHSHYIVEQMGALVNAGAASVDPEERRLHLGLLGRDIDGSVYLEQGEVGVYEFESQGELGSPSNVNELEFDGDYLGYYPLGYSKALADQRNRNIRMIGAREGF